MFRPLRHVLDRIVTTGHLRLIDADGCAHAFGDRSGSPIAARITDRVAPGVVYTTFHHPDTQANVVTSDYSDWATNCPEYKVTAVQVAPSNGPTDWQTEYRHHSQESRRIARQVALPAAE